MARILADNAHDTLATDDLAIAAYFFYRGAYFHVLLLAVPSFSFRAESDPAARQIVG